MTAESEFSGQEGLMRVCEMALKNSALERPQGDPELDDRDKGKAAGQAPHGLKDPEARPAGPTPGSMGPRLS